MVFERSLGQEVADILSAPGGGLLDLGFRDSGGSLPVRGGGRVDVHSHRLERIGTADAETIESGARGEVVWRGHDGERFVGDGSGDGRVRVTVRRDSMVLEYLEDETKCFDG